jgi:phage shock protein E
MINFLKNLLNPGPALNIEELLQKGAVIVDVRTEGEFRSGHAKGSINIPFDKLNKSLSKLNKNKPVITCCASGMRSESAMSILKKNGFLEVYNAGSWTRLNKN